MMGIGAAVLDAQQLRAATLHDPTLMRQVLSMLLDDAPRQIALLADAIRSGNRPRSLELAHFSKGAYLMAGAQRVAAIFETIERCAAVGEFPNVPETLAALSHEIDLLRAAAARL
jgi:HPt (histidine-containing phosphotransfer) domain-containing protein